jgi:hypothetical protein
MINPGQNTSLKALRKTDNGIYLVDEELNEVLLPNKYIPVDFELGNTINVFIYKDSEDRIIATTLQPLIQINSFAPLVAIDKNRYGAFFNWGLEKDLFVPYSQQLNPIEVGKTYVVYMYLDNVTQRLVGSTKINHRLERDEISIEIGEQVELLVYDESEVGFSVIVNNIYRGILYENEVFKLINIGDRLQGYVKKIRSDKKLDISLNKFGYRSVDANVSKLMDVLSANNGFLPINDKSAPELIYQKLGMSKKVFKKAVGALLKENKIIFINKGIQLKIETK